jgi:hypothetical protein
MFPVQCLAGPEGTRNVESSEPAEIFSISSGSPLAHQTQVSWETTVAADSQVEYGTTSGYGSTTAIDPADVTSHSVIVAGLTHNTTYHYRVRSEDINGNVVYSDDQTFVTANTSWHADTVVGSDATVLAQYFAGEYTTTDAWLTAAGGVAGSGEFVLGPTLGAEQVANGGYTGGLTGHTAGSGWTGVNDRAHKGTGAASGITQAIALGTRMIRAAMDVIAQNAGNLWIQATGSATVAGVNRTAPGNYSEYLSLLGATSIGPRGDAACTDADIDNFSVQICTPFEGYNFSGLTLLVEGITASNHAVETWLGPKLVDASGLNYVGVLRDTSGNIRCQTANSFGSAACDIDLGNVADSTSYAVAFGVQANACAASLNGATAVTDNTAIIPPVGILILKTTENGQVTASRMTNANLALASPNPGASFYIPGDSIGRSSGGGEIIAGVDQWQNILAASYTPARAVYNLDATGGYQSDDIAASMAADTLHAGWVHLLWDGGFGPTENPVTWMSDITAAFVGRSPKRLIIGPLKNLDEPSWDANIDALLALQQTEWGDNHLDLNSVLSDPSTRGPDGWHPSAAGYAAAAAAIRTRLDLLGY